MSEPKERLKGRETYCTAKWRVSILFLLFYSVLTCFTVVTKLSLSIPGLQSDVEVLKATLERNKELISEKEREMVRRVQAAREEEIHRMAALQEEK